MLSTNFYRKNRKKLSEYVEDNSLIVIAANGLMQRSGGTTFAFRQDSNFYYLTGLSKLADAVLVLDGAEEFLILPKQTEFERIADGELNCDEIANISGITRLYENTEGWNKLKKMQQSRNKIYLIKPPAPRVENFYTNPTRARLRQKLVRSGVDQSVICDIRPILTEMRQVKQPEEIEAIKTAIAITGEAFEVARNKLCVGMTEQALRAEFDYIFSKHGVDHAYEPVIAHGARSTIIHNAPLPSQKMLKDDWTLVDIGAEFAGYSADVTRMLRVSGAMSKRHMAVYQSVENIFEQCLTRLRPGVTFIEYARWAQSIVGKELVRLGLTDDENDKKAIRKYFPHLISHSLGLDTHDVFDYYKVILAENMVITVEPGIYIPEEGIGVRIEDDILITKGGIKNLSRSIAY